MVFACRTSNEVREGFWLGVDFFEDLGWFLRFGNWGFGGGGLEGQPKLGFKGFYYADSSAPTLIVGSGEEYFLTNTLPG